MPDLYNSTDKPHQTEQTGLSPLMFGHLEDVQNDPRLTTQEKRAVLASWASDANAVPHLPTLRQLPDGSIVRLSDILRTLNALDAGSEHEPAASSHNVFWRQPYRRRRLTLRGWTRRSRGPDDDDLPPCPAYAAIPPNNGGGAAFAHPEPVPA